MAEKKIFGLTPRYTELLVVLIAFITLISGLVQMLAPSFMLGFIGKEVATASSAHFFGIVGMFMALFGGMLLHAVYSAVTNKQVVLWSALQKFGAFIAVSIGVFNGLFSILAMSVAIFDLFSGLVFFIYLRVLNRSNP
ncbi:patatin [Cyclobacterium sp. 1_MG-2023]|uniref:patatin n=1 Tax=Cyclobacterium sp. 1_MG-2023 TaxID=3062681 RepID=UPI0026E41CA8|nr:patatin [Cyclobacterium sp. 1_MG-2023]MDO6436141.1 patatin [Cyclobacterium sp. 1_MG-2023]